MDSYEATRTVLSRIHSLEADNATKIMGYLLLKDYGEKEMIRFALGPDTIIHNLIFEAKTQLGLLTKSPSTPSSPFIPFSRPNPLSLSSSPKITNNAFDFKNPSSNTWSLSGFSVSRSLNNQPISPSSFPSYASVLNRSSDSGSRSLSSPKVSSSFTSHNSSSVTHDEYLIQNDLSFLNDSKVEDLYDSRVEFSSNTDTNCKNLHNPNDYSVPEMLLGAEDLNSGFEWKPCLYFARGFCKNGSSCRFLHEDSTVDGAATVGPPNNNLNELEQCQELLRLKYAAQRLKLGSETPFVTGTSLPYNNCLNFHMQQVDNQRSATTAFEVGDELQKFGQCRIEGNEFSGMNLGGSLSPASRQIYLTFPADSTFREEDVSNYFSLYGPVQDVRIPYQQKRMFGFVTFVYSETVKLILAKGNPHFVCDSRVLVKPYKEKGKLLEKKQQHLERGDYSLCSSPTTPNCIDSYDLSHGARMYYNAQEVLLMKTLEEKANFQQAIDLQERRLINLQLLELKNNNYHRQQYHHGLSSGSPIPSPTLSQTFNHRASIIELNGTYQDVPEENNLSPVSTIPQTSVVDGDQQQQQQQQQQVNAGCNNSGVYDDKIGTEYFKTEESELHRRVEHVLPHNLFSSPEKSSGDDNNFSSASNNNSDLSSNSTLNIVSPETVFSKCPGYHLLGLEPLECN